MSWIEEEDLTEQEVAAMWRRTDRYGWARLWMVLNAYRRILVLMFTGSCSDVVKALGDELSSQKLAELLAAEFKLMEEFVRG